ncbi:MAG: hypothetical protein ACRC90_05505 [Lactococcus garvieae]
MVKKEGKQLSDIDSSLLEKRYHFIVESSSLSDRPVLPLLEDLEKSFPQIIWTKIIKTTSNRYKIEFIPVAFQNQRKDEDGILADTLEEMGMHSSEFILNFREKVEEVLKNWQCASPVEISPTFEGENKQEEASHPKEDTEDPLLLRLKKLQNEVEKQSAQKEGPHVQKNSLFKKKKTK